MRCRFVQANGLGAGEQLRIWVHRSCVVAAINVLRQHPLEAAVNLAGPEPVT